MKLAVKKSEKKSFLYHLEPMGLGSGLVESLSSYLSRLAEAHCVTLNTLLSRVLLPRSALHINSKSLNTNFYSRDAKTINGVGKYAKHISSITKELTLQPNIRLLTMLPLSKVIGSSGRRLLKSDKYWCELCFQDQLKKYGYMYEPLQWCLSPVSHCWKHGLVLEDKCPQCKKKQWPLLKQTPLGYCQYCGFCLASERKYPSRSEIDTSNPKWLSWLNISLMEFFENGYFYDNEYSYSDFICSLKCLINEISTGNAADIEQKLGYGVGTIAQWRRGRNKPRFDCLLHLSSQVGLSLSQLLQFETQKNDVKKMLIANVERPSFGNSKRYTTEKLQKCASYIDQVLCSEKICTVNQIKSELGVSIGFLKYRFPEQMQKITARNKKLREQKNRAKLLQDEKLIRRRMYELHSKGAYPSQDKTLSNQDFNITWHKAKECPHRRIWREVLIELGY